MNKENLNSRILIAFVLLLLIAIPIVFFYYKSKNTNQQTSSIETFDLNALEKNYNALPDAANTINLSLAYINKGMPGKADYILQNYIQKDSSNVIVYNNLGVANNLLKNYKLAIGYCRKAIQLDSTFTLANNNLKWALQEVAVIRKNIDQLQTQLNNPSAEPNHLKLGLCYMQIGELDSSIIIFKQGQLKYPKDESYPTNIGTAFMMKKEYDTALQYFKEALAINPTSRLSNNNLNWAKQALLEGKK